MAKIDLDLGVKLDGSWVNAVDVGSGVKSGPKLSVVRGRSDWAREVDPSALSAVLGNNDGRWSPDYESGAYHGDLKRFVPVRAGRAHGDPYLHATGHDALIAPNDAAFNNITGDIDIRIEYEPWISVEDVLLGNGFNRIYLVSCIDGTGPTGFDLRLQHLRGVPVIRFRWYDSSNTSQAYESLDTTGVAPWSLMFEHSAIRLTLDVDDGASDSLCRFYYSDDGTLDGDWVEIGDGASGLGVTDLAGSNPATLKLMGNPNGSFYPMVGKLDAFELRDGIDGTVAANPDLSGETVGASTFDDASGLTWNVGDDGEVTDQSWRFHGELDSIDIGLSLHGRYTTAPIEAKGLFYRLLLDSQSQSPLRRGLLQSDTSLVQYWPCEEEGDRVEQFGAVVGTAPIKVTRGYPQAANNGDFLSSNPIPTLKDDAWTAVVDSYSDSTAWTVTWLMSIPEDFSEPTGLTLLRVETDEYQYEVQFQDGASGGSLRYVVYDGSTTIYTRTWVGFEATGKPLRMSLQVRDDGSDIDIALLGLKESESGGGGVNDNTPVTGVGAGNVTVIQVNPESACEGWGIGHLTLHSDWVTLSEVEDAFAGHRGEKAAPRIQRLCREEGLDCYVFGNPYDSQSMGPQQPGTIMELLRECARTDMGILFESSTHLAVGYRTRQSMLAQGDRIADETGLVLWHSSADAVTTDQTILPNRAPGSVAEAEFGASTAAPTITLATSTDFTRIDADGGDYIDTDYTPSFTATTGQLTLIWAGYWSSTDTTANTPRLVSSESSSQDGLLLHGSGVAQAEPKIRVGGSVGTAQASPTIGPSLSDGQRYACAAVIDEGDLYFYYHGVGLSAATDITGVGTITHDPIRVFATAFTNGNNSAGGMLELMAVERAMGSAELVEICGRLFDRLELGVVDLDMSNLRHLEPRRDGQLQKNRITVNNRLGGQAVAELADGSALSTSAPPTGSGLQPLTYQVNAGQSVLQRIADRLLTLSTVDGPRIPRMSVRLSKPDNSDVVDDLLDMRLGDLATVNDTPAVWNGGDQLSQIVQGTKETLTIVQHDIEMLTTPGEPWRPGELVVAGPLDVSGVNNTRGTGGPRTVTNPVQSTGNTILFGAIAAGPSQIATGAWTPPDSDAVVVFDYPGWQFVPRFRIWAWEEDGSANYTGGWSDATDLQSDWILGFDGVVGELTVTAEIVDSKADADYPPVSTEAGSLVLTVDVQQGGSNELTDGPADYTEEWNDTGTNSPRAFAIHSAYATGDVEQPGNGTWDLEDNAHLRLTIAAKR